MRSHCTLPCWRAPPPFVTTTLPSRLGNQIILDISGNFPPCGAVPTAILESYPSLVVSPAIPLQMACTFGAMYGSTMLLSTTIKEEEEEDLDDSHSPRFSNLLQHFNKRCDTRHEVCRLNCGKHCDGQVAHSPDRDRRMSHLAASAVASVTAATSKLFGRLLHSQHHGQHHYHRRCGGGNHDCAIANTMAASASASTPAAALSRAEALEIKRSDAVLAPFNRKSCGSGNAAAAASARIEAQQSRQHLVRLMDDDDVSLAMQALQLAAQIHDHVWSPYGPIEHDLARRQALLEAAGPLYDDAMTAARAIRHRALHSLVKQSVRRYVNPAHGSPDDVLRVILELLTGCGAAGPARGGEASGGSGDAAFESPFFSSQRRMVRSDSRDSVYGSEAPEPEAAPKVPWDGSAESPRSCGSPGSSCHDSGPQSNSGRSSLSGGSSSRSTCSSSGSGEKYFLHAFGTRSAF